MAHTNPDDLRAWKRAWYAKNAERLQAQRKAKGYRANERERRRIRRAIDSEYHERQKANLRRSRTRRPASPRAHKPWAEWTLSQKLRHAIGGRIRRYLTKGQKAGRTTEAMLGYSVADLRAHIERQFLNGMSWDNYGEWHIDHIVPIASFDLEADGAVAACWALTNLRPLWSTDNQQKGAARVLLI